MQESSSSALSIGEAIPKATRKDQFIKLADAPFNDRSLAYTLVVPKTWGVDTSLRHASPGLSAQGLKPLLLLRGEAGPLGDVYVQVQAMLLTRELTAAHWLKRLALAAGRGIEEEKELSPWFADQLAKGVIEQVPFCFRSVARIDGNRVFLVTALAPEAAWSDIEQEVGLCVASFDLTQPVKTGQIEGRASYTLGHRLRVQVPISWRAQTQDDLGSGRSVLDLFQLDDEDILLGRMRLKLAEKRVMDSLPAMLKATLEEWSGAGISLGSELFSDIVSSEYDHFKKGPQLIYEAFIEGSSIPQELWLFLFETVEHYFCMSLLTPGRDEHFGPWAINKRAFELVADAIKYVG